MSGKSDRQLLILAAQTGDLAALDQLLRMCQPDAKRYAQLHCHASHVDDAIQEALLVITRRIHTLKIVAAFSSWLFTTIKRECQKLFSPSRKNQQLSPDEWEALIIEKSDAALHIDLIAALESLPPHYLKVILLRDFEELTIAEISERLNENAAAIKSRLHRARELVREYFYAK
jgi:RNA polymerase sigma factor (sigma-70 family)